MEKEFFTELRPSEEIQKELTEKERQIEADINSPHHLEWIKERNKLYQELQLAQMKEWNL